MAALTKKEIELVVTIPCYRSADRQLLGLERERFSQLGAGGESRQDPAWERPSEQVEATQPLQHGRPVPESL